MIKMISGILVTAMVAACGSSDRPTTELPESERCMDAICEGDVLPTVGPNEVLVKLNGQWFAVPKPYSKDLSGLAFYWPSKTPVSGRPDGQPFPELGRDYYDVAIEVFLSHRRYFPPQSQYGQLRQAEAEGRLVSKQQIRPGLEVWRTREKDVLGPGVWYVATDRVASDPDGAVLYCRGEMKDARCSTAVRWQPNVAVELRFRAAHSADWPAIYEEVVRVLQLIRKV